MSAPTLTGAALKLADALPTLTAADSDANNWAGNLLCGAIGAILDAGASLTTITEDTDAFPGWTIITDPAEAPAEWLTWQADLFGVRLIIGQTTSQHRTRIADLPAQERGTPDAMIAAVQATLTGTKAITVTERLGDHAYRMLVVTYEAETPDPDATRVAALSQKPAAIMDETGETTDIVRVDPGWSYAQAQEFHDGETYAAAQAVYDDYTEASTVIPEV